MGRYRDRTARLATEAVGALPGAEAEGGLSSIEVQAENPVMLRAKVAVKYMVSKGGTGPKAATMRIVNKIVSEALTDASDVPPEIAEFYMKQLSAMIYWVATGETAGDIPMPEDFKTE